jgi:integrase
MGEALGLKWEDVDLERSTVFIRRALQRVTKEDGTTELRLVEPKSEGSYRVVSIPASIVAFLTRHRAQQNRERLVAGSRWQTTGHAFTSTIGTPLDERNVRREFYDLLKAQNLPRMRPHGLRHSYATILLAAGEHPKVVQEILGHSSVQLTLDTYSHLLPDLMLKERAAAKLDAILSGGNNNPGQNPGQSDQPQVDDQEKSSNLLGEEVSRDGIEPSTRRLRVCCSAN